VDLLKRVLILQAAVWAACGVTLALAPRFVLVTLFDLPEPSELGYVRVAGVCSLSLAMLMVLLSRRLAELWWWSWAFVVAAAGTAIIALLNALFGLADGASPLLWWLFAAASMAFTVGLLAGLAKAGTERPPL
jgi:hypothetical protein